MSETYSEQINKPGEKQPSPAQARGVSGKSDADAAPQAARLLDGGVHIRDLPLMSAAALAKLIGNNAMLELIDRRGALTAGSPPDMSFPAREPFAVPEALQPLTLAAPAPIAEPLSINSCEVHGDSLG